MPELDAEHGITDDRGDGSPRLGPLHREHHGLGCDFAGGRPELEQALPSARRVRRVVDDEPTLLGQAKGEHIVGDATLIRAIEGIVRLAWRERADVVRQRRPQSRRRLPPLHPDPPHVRHVEDPGAPADGEVLGDDALVLQRHLPAGERREARARRVVHIAQR